MSTSCSDFSRSETQSASDLLAAQAAIDFPEVREMLQKLSKYNLGVCFPHIHTESEDFSKLPDGTVQVEKNLRVSFEDLGSGVLAQAVPVAWCWTGNNDSGRVRPVAACVPMSDKTHKKLPGT